MNVFVYGTLKRGFPNHGWIKSAKGHYLSDGVLIGAVMFNLGSFPGVKLTPTRTMRQVTGELFEVPDDGLKVLDRLEGYPGFYDRESVVVLTPTNTSYDAMVYTYPHEVEPDQLIESGVWSMQERGASR